MSKVEKIRAEMAELERKLAEAEAEEEMASKRESAMEAIALLSAMRSIKMKLDKVWPGAFEGEKWVTLNNMSYWPRSTGMKRAAGLSADDVEAASKRGSEAVSALL